jgi:hypothetical protein
LAVDEAAATASVGDEATDGSGGDSQEKINVWTQKRAQRQNIR